MDFLRNLLSFNKTKKISNLTEVSNFIKTLSNIPFIDTSGTTHVLDSEYYRKSRLYDNGVEIYLDHWDGDGMEDAFDNLLNYNSDIDNDDFELKSSYSTNENDIIVFSKSQPCELCGAHGFTLRIEIPNAKN